MGLLNTENGRQTNNTSLINGICILCNRKRMLPASIDGQELTFDYICRFCNPMVNISITNQVFLLKLLDRFNENPEARVLLRNEVVAATDRVFKIDTDIINYFLGYSKQFTITYTSWFNGDVTGDVNNWKVSEEELTKIQTEQRTIFSKKVSEKVEYLKKNFNHRKKESSDPKYMLAQQINHLNDILIKDRYKFDHKPIANEPISIGIYQFRSYQLLQQLQHYYTLSLSGLLNYGIVPNEKQKIGMPSQRAQFMSMVEAVAFTHFRKYLEGMHSPKNELLQDQKFSSEKISEIEKKLDELKDIVLEGFNKNNDRQTAILYELQDGQEVIFNEFDDLKTLLPTLKKKSWVQLVRSKLFDLAAKKLLTKETLAYVTEKFKEAGIDLTNIDTTNFI